MKQRFLNIFVLFILSCLLLVACNSNEETTGSADKNENGNESQVDNQEQEPVVVRMSTSHVDRGWLEEMKVKVEEKYPYITLELVDMPNVDNEEFEDWVFQNEIPDILTILEQRRDLAILREYELEYDFEHIVEAKGFDLSVFEESIINSLRNATPTGGIVAIPFQSNYFAVNFNKDIFDRFGVPYPTEPMTWSEVMQLAAQLTREMDGVQYHGVTMNPYLAWFIFTQFEENLIDPDTLEVNAINSTALQNIFKMLQEYASIPGNIPEGHWGTNFEEGNVAMDINWARTYNVRDGIEGVNFDFAPFPTWEANPGKNVEPNVTAWTISSVSEVKEAAFDVIAYLSSAEARLPEIRKGSIPVLSSPEIHEQFMADIENYDEYNLKALVAVPFSSGPPKISLYENNAPLRELMEKYVIEKRDMDVNAYLREVQQELENYIKDQVGRE